MMNQLRQRRKLAGLSQAQLAQRVAVSRQALIAIEAGRQVPSTTLALLLARELGCTVEQLFSLPEPAVHAVWAGPSDAGRRVTVARVGDRLVAHPHGTGACDAIVVGAALGEEVVVQPLDHRRALGDHVLVAGCAPLLSVLSERFTQRRSSCATWIRSNSDRSLSLLKEGKVHVAGVHLVDSSRRGGHEAIIRRHFAGQCMTLVNLAVWRQGLIVAAGNPKSILCVQDLLRSDVRVVRRAPGAGAHKLLERELGQDFRDQWDRGPQVFGHEEVASVVAWGLADVGVGIEAVALQRGLGFIPLREERFDLVVPDKLLAQSSVEQLLRFVDQPSFRLEANSCPGYDLTYTGHSVTVDGGVR